MTAAEKIRKYGDSYYGDNTFGPYMQREIAAQLAELNENLKALIDAVANGGSGRRDGGRRLNSF